MSIDPNDIIPVADLPLGTPGPSDHMVGVDTSSGRARRFPIPIAGTPQAYLTRASLPASAPEGTAAYVTNDPTASNNGMWAYRGGQWVQSADRTTQIEARVVSTEQAVGVLDGRMGSTEQGVKETGDRILDLTDNVPQDATGPYAWAVVDDAGRVLLGVRDDGKVDAQLRDVFAGSDVPVDGVAAAIVDEAGRALVSWDEDGTLRALLPSDTAPRRYPISDAQDDIAYGVVDDAGRLLFGVQRNGQFVAHGIGGGLSSVRDAVADVSDGDLYITTIAGRRLVVTAGPWPFHGATVAGSDLLASQARPLLGGDRMVTVSDDGLVVPEGQLLTHYIGFGQSLSMGSNGYPLISTENAYPNRSLMYAGLDVRAGLPATGTLVSIDPATLTGFEPLIAKGDSTLRGQTHLESIGEILASNIEQRTSANHQMLFSTFGWGGTPYAGLKKGTVPYNNILAAATKTKALASARGLAYWVPAICFQHGEGDAGNAAYFDNLVELQADLNSDLRAITGQTAPVRIYMGQVSSFQNTVSNNVSRSAYSIYRAAKELQDRYTIVCPQYTIPYSSDLLHMSGPGYYILGEYYAKALLAEQYGSGQWTPLRPKTITLSGSQIDITFHVPVEPIVLDTTLVSDPGDYGFVYYDAQSSAAIQSVAITGPDSIRITLTAAPTGANKRLTYAMRGYGSPREPGQGPRGCLRDSDMTPSRLGGYLHNWCLHFQEEL